MEITATGTCVVGGGAMVHVLCCGRLGGAVCVAIGLVGHLGDVVGRCRVLATTVIYFAGRCCIQFAVRRVLRR